MGYNCKHLEYEKIIFFMSNLSSGTISNGAESKCKYNSDRWRFFF